MAKPDSQPDVPEDGTSDFDTNPTDITELDGLLDEAGVIEQPEETSAPAETETPAETPEEKPAETPEEKPAETPEEKPEQEETVDEPKLPIPTEKAEGVEVEPETPDSDVDAIKEPINLSPTNKENWKQLRNTAKERGQKLKELETQVQELQSRQTSLPENVEQELNELRSFRRTFDIQNDPDFKQKYDGAIEQNREMAYSILEKHQVPKDQIDWLRQHGLENIDMQMFQEKVIDPLMKGDLDQRKDAATLKKVLDNNLTLMADKDLAIKEASKQGSQWEQAQVKKQKEFVENFDKVVESRILETQKQVPWAQYREVPPTATPEQKAQIEKDNTFFKKYVEPVFSRAMYDPSPEARVDTAMAAVLAFKYSDELASLTQKYNKLVDEHNKIRSAGRMRPSNVPKQKSTPQVKDVLSMTDDEAIDAGMKELGM